jgi:hypothetical protein
MLMRISSFLYYGLGCQKSIEKLEDMQSRPGPKSFKRGTKEMGEKKFPVRMFFAGSMMLRTLGLTQ